MPDISTEVPPGFTLLQTFHEHEKKINQVVWSPDGKLLASASRDATIQIWDLKTGKLQRVFEGNFNYSVAWSPNGKTLAVGCARSFLLWDTETGQMLWESKIEAQSTTSVAWSPSGQMLASGFNDGSINLWNAESKQLYRTLLELGHSRKVNSIAWSPNGRMLASGSADNSVRLWNAETGKLIWMFDGHASEINSVAWSPDGKILASASSDHTIRLWDTTVQLRIDDPFLDPKTNLQIDAPQTYSAELEDSKNFGDVQFSPQLGVLKGHVGPVICVSFSPDGRLLASKSLDGTIRFWRTNTLEMVTFLDEPALPYGWYAGLAFNPNASVLAVVGEKDTVIRVWNLDINAILDPHSVISSFSYTNSKVVLVGDRGVGKTALSLVLTKQPFIPPESTHGRNILVFDTQIIEIGSRSWEMREILLWDLAGQPNYRLIHQMHLDEAAMALIVFDASNETDPFAGVRYWNHALHQAQRLQNDSNPSLKKILVAARVDQGGSGVNQTRVNELVNKLGFDEYFKTSSREGTNIELLAEAIKKAIDWNRIPKVDSTDIFQRIKNFIVRQKEDGWKLSTTGDLYRMFEATESNRIEDEEKRIQFEICISQLESQGLIRRFSFGNHILLWPELLDAYASALIDTVKSEPDGLGSIAKERVLAGNFSLPKDKRIKDQEKSLLIEMVEDLLRYEIAFSELTDDGEYLVFPSLVTRENPNLLDPKGQSVRFDFEGPVLNVYATLVVRLTHSGEFMKKEIYDNAVIYTSREPGIFGLILHNIGGGRGELTLFFDRDARKGMRFHFETYIDKQLRKWASGINRILLLTCPKCGVPFDESIVRRRREFFFNDIVCGFCETRVSIIDQEEGLIMVDQSLISKMDNAADAQREREVAASILQGKIATGDFDVFLCHNSNDKSEVKKIGEKLKEYGILPWLDEWEVSPFVSWQDELQKVISQMKAVAVFVGLSGVGPWEDIEMKAFLMEFARRKLRMGLVYLSDCVQEPEVPLFMKIFNWVDFRKEAPDPLEHLIWGITGKRSTTRVSERSIRESDAVTTIETKYISKDNGNRSKKLTENIEGYWRPATAFLSYKRQDAEQVKYLQQQLKVRGVRAWRDVTDITLGGFTEHEIVQAIKQESDAFVIYITPECLQSNFIWDIEVPAALQRWEQDHTFNIVPILRGVTFAQIQQNSVVRGYDSLTQFNAVSLPDPDRDKEQFNKELQSIAERILRATYTLRLRRVGADRTYEPRINFHTFRYEPPTPTLDLDLDWTELFEGPDEVPTSYEWNDLLLPALNDVKNMLSVKTPSRKLHIYSNARLPAAIALGAAIPAPAHFELLLHSDHDTWSTKGTPTDSSPLRLLPYHEKGDVHTALIELAISRNTAPGIAQSLPTLNISYKHHIRFEPKDEPPNSDAVKDAAHALAMSRQIGNELRSFCDNKSISHIHLFAALPVELAVMVGHQLNALCTVTLYYYRNSDQRYVPTCTLK